ncbi:hypothetical protein Pcac1_g29370 [Phytophthora cactorum]|nr:hypothetical protein Pcac1_g29370 [Phytophthora cactorum]
MSTSMSRPLDFHRRFLMKMSTTWNFESLDIDNDGSGADGVHAGREAQETARVTKMKLPEDRELCVIDLDWKKQVRRTTPLRTEQTQTKEEKHGDEDDDSTLTSFLACKCQCRRSRRSIGADDIPRSGERPDQVATGARRFVLSSSRCDFVVCFVLQVA